jgi:acyl-CoA dehydrogenase
MKDNINIAAFESPWMTEELKILEDAVTTFYQREMVPHIDKWETNGVVDHDPWHKAGEAGILCASISEEYGGGGGDFTNECVINQQQTRAGISGFGNSVHSGIVAHYIQSYVTEEQKKKWLPRMATGELVGGIAMTEPGTGSDLQGAKTTALESGNDMSSIGKIPSSPMVKALNSFALSLRRTRPMAPRVFL